MTHLKTNGATEQELEALALFMGHSQHMQRSTYDRCSKSAHASCCFMAVAAHAWGIVHRHGLQLLCSLGTARMPCNTAFMQDSAEDVMITNAGSGMRMPCFAELLRRLVVLHALAELTGRHTWSCMQAGTGCMDAN